MASTGDIFEKITFGFGIIGICFPPIIALIMNSKYDASNYKNIFYPVIVGFMLYILSCIYYQPNDDKLQSVLIVMVCGAILFSLCTSTLISLRMRFAA